jgi:hypothetical protein
MESTMPENELFAMSSKPWGENRRANMPISSGGRSNFVRLYLRAKQTIDLPLAAPQHPVLLMTPAPNLPHCGINGLQEIRLLKISQPNRSDSVITLKTIE